MTRATVSTHTAHSGSVGRYLTGYIASLVLTLTAYVLVSLHSGGSNGPLRMTTLLAALAGLAVVQVIVQLVCFLHVGQETRPRWKLGVLLFMIAVVIIVVLGSLWIMANLNDHMMSPTDINTYMQDQESL